MVLYFHEPANRPWGVPLLHRRHLLSWGAYRKVMDLVAIATPKLSLFNHNAFDRR